MQKLLIIDGSNLLFQMFFGMPSRIVNERGKAIQGTLGFAGALLKIIRMTVPTHVVVIFDGEHDNPRAEADENYKANRVDYTDVPVEENPFSQLSDIYKALDCLGIKHNETEEFEADDVIASYVCKYGEKTKIVISSFDSDFFQLVNYNVSVLRYRGKKTTICDVDYVKEKLNILPTQYADFKSFTGDEADNIKGINKVGPKTAAKLVNQFGNLESVIDRADEIERETLKNAVKDHAERLRLNYRLIKLDGKAKLPFAEDELLYEYGGVTTNEVLRAINLI
jgi:5''-3'' exonuclease (including N-terminal domain of PolI)